MRQAFRIENDPAANGQMLSQERHESITAVSQHEIVEPDSARDRACGREELDQQFAEMVGSNTIEVVFSLTARLDEPRNAQQSQVMADRWLALTETVAQVRHMQLVVLGEIEQD